MNFDKDDPKEGSQTCHLCGKVQCGQRLGRVKCCQCNRIFCLQQLSRKFHIIATANDPYFKCPRCTGICCCVCNCQKPPPHVHCKVYKVRQNKLKQASLHDHHYASDLPKPITPDIPVLAPIVDESPFPNRPYQPETAPTTQVARWEGISNTWQDPQALWQLPNLDVSGIQNSDGLTQLNLHLLDNWDQNYYNAPNQNYEGFRKFSDNLKLYFDGWQDMTEYDRNSLETRLLAEAAKLQLKAAKTDVLFKMLDSFNKNSIQVTVTWQLLDNSLERKPIANSLPSLFTIVKHYPTVLFTLENNSDFEETMHMGKITITFMNTGAVKDVKSLCTCIALLDNSFRRFADVTVSEQWTEPDVSYKAIGNIDHKKLKEMINFAERSQKVMEASTNSCRVCVSYSRSKEETYFENLPLISLILKRVSNDFPDVVFSLWRMVCDDKRVVCVLQFSEDKNWVKVINGYESSIEVCSEEQYKSMSRTNSQPVLLDLWGVCWHYCLSEWKVYWVISNLLLE